MTSTTAINILSFIQQFSSYSNYIIFTIGITGNILNILVFTGLKTFRNNQCAFYLTTEAISNIIQLIISFLVRILITLYGTDPTGSVLFWCKLRGIIIILCTVISFSAVCFAAFDQYLSTNHQFYLREKSTIKLAKTLVLIATCFSLLHIIPFGIFVKIQSSSCLVFDPTMSNYISYFYYPVLTGILPIFIASLFSFFAYQNVRRIVRRQIAIIRRRLDRQSNSYGSYSCDCLCYSHITLCYTEGICIYHQSGSIQSTRICNCDSSVGTC